jgi:hypothetical protein
VPFSFHWFFQNEEYLCLLNCDIRNTLTPSVWCLFILLNVSDAVLRDVSSVNFPLYASYHSRIVLCMKSASVSVSVLATYRMHRCCRIVNFALLNLTFKRRHARRSMISCVHLYSLLSLFRIRNRESVHFISISLAHQSFCFLPPRAPARASCAFIPFVCVARMRASVGSVGSRTNICFIRCTCNCDCVQ